MAGALGACAPTPQAKDALTVEDWQPVYGTIETKLLDGGLVNLVVQMENARSNGDVIAYNDCAAAQYAVIRGAQYVRRVQNDVTYGRGIWMGTGTYTLSDAHPGGTFVIHAEQAVADCAANSIPTV